jgi:hypothetical protein
MNNENDAEATVIRAVTGRIESAGAMRLLDATGKWPRFEWMGSEMTFDSLRRADSKDIEYSLIERRGTLRGVDPDQRIHVESDIAGFERLSKARSVFIVSFVNLPEMSSPSFDRVLLGLEFFVDPESEFVQLSALPLRRR